MKLSSDHIVQIAKREEIEGTAQFMRQFDGKKRIYLKPDELRHLLGCAYWAGAAREGRNV